jgi:hypothetical protein
MITGTTKSLEITEEPSLHITASTKALMAQDQYQEATMPLDDTIRYQHMVIIIQIHELIHTTQIMVWVQQFG